MLLHIPIDGRLCLTIQDGYVGLTTVMHMADTQTRPRPAKKDTQTLKMYHNT